jgi:HlyD family secretion protein
VFVVEGGRARLQPVSLAVRNATHAWLNDGLAAGLAVVIYPPAALADGSVVRLRRP